MHTWAVSGETCTQLQLHGARAPLPWYSTGTVFLLACCEPGSPVANTTNCSRLVSHVWLLQLYTCTQPDYWVRVVSWVVSLVRVVRVVPWVVSLGLCAKWRGFPMLTRLESTHPGQLAMGTVHHTTGTVSRKAAKRSACGNQGTDTREVTPCWLAGHHLGA